MPLGSYTSAAFTTASGVAVAATADVEVRRESDGALASIFSDRAGATPIAQPGFQADSNGRFIFYAAGISGGYQVKVTKGAETHTTRYQATGTAREYDASTYGAGLMNAADAAAARVLLVLLKLISPGGRLTLTTAVPVTSADVAGATTVYYTPYRHDIIELYDGTGWVPKQFTELSQATTDATKSPLAVAADANYDVFVWDDAGTLRATRGPAWTSDTARGTGAGTTELEHFEGRYVNKVDITNGPAARRGLYVGTIRSDGSSQINDSAAKRHVWNNYNRVARAMRVLEATDSWAYTAGTIRQANGSTANQLDFVRGLDEDEACAQIAAGVSNNTANVGVDVRVGLDSTTAGAAGCINGFGATQASNTAFTVYAMWRGMPGLGRHFLAWLERSNPTGTTTWYGDQSTPTQVQSGIEGGMLA